MGDGQEGVLVSLQERSEEAAAGQGDNPGDQEQGPVQDLGGDHEDDDGGGKMPESCPEERTQESQGII